MFTRHKPGAGRWGQEHFHKLLGTEVRSPRASGFNNCSLSSSQRRGTGNHGFRCSLVELTGEVRPELNCSG